MALSCSDGVLVGPDIVAVSRPVVRAVTTTSLLLEGVDDGVLLLSMPVVVLTVSSCTTGNVAGVPSENRRSVWSAELVAAGAGGETIAPGNGGSASTSLKSTKVPACVLEGDDAAVAVNAAVSVPGMKPLDGRRLLCELPDARRLCGDASDGEIRLDADRGVAGSSDSR